MKRKEKKKNLLLHLFHYNDCRDMSPYRNLYFFFHLFITIIEAFSVAIVFILTEIYHIQPLTLKTEIINEYNKYGSELMYSIDTK